MPARADHDDRSVVSVPFNAGRGLMRRRRWAARRPGRRVSVPFNAGRGLMRIHHPERKTARTCFSTLQCGSWIDAYRRYGVIWQPIAVSVPFNAGRGLMQQKTARATGQNDRFSTLQCGSWIDA